MKKVDFIVIGAGKCGTTWLHEKLIQHPALFIPRKKELEYFNKYRTDYIDLINANYNKKIEWYESFFSKGKKEQIFGEISSQYLYNLNTSQDIYNYNKNIKIIAIIRNPIERSYSEYLYTQQRGLDINHDFESAICKNPFIINNSFYFDKLVPYFNLFNKENILVLKYDLLKENSQVFFKKTLDFIEVSEYYPPDFYKKANVTKSVRFNAINIFINKMRYLIHKNNLNFLLLIIKLGCLPKNNYIYLKNK